MLLGMGDKTAAVIGAGPAGLFAAEQLANAGLAVTIHELRRSPARKFVLAGRGGLNITHSEPAADFLDRYAEARPRLEPALARFGPAELREWCAGLGQPTFVGSSGRVFPEAFRATPLLRAWLHRLDGLGVRLETGRRWMGWADDGDAVFSTASGDLMVAADVTVVALGGASWPRVGGDGGWVPIFEHEGITVRPLVPANGGVRVPWSQVFVERFAGVPLKNVSVSVDGAARPPTRGDVMVTATGLEGGPIYANSAALRGAIEERGAATVVVDLQPDLTEQAVGARLAHRRAKENVTRWLQRAGLDPAAVSLLREATANVLPSDPAAMAALIKGVPIVAPEMMPIDRAISSAGGVDWDEVDEHFMLRRRLGVFVAGEMLDWEAPTGGYLLQACFSTGLAAAEGALVWLARRS
ncbi:MAG: TIGR03862 family flavoprotein [Acidimicrobiales bacterium]|nr:TIGR03862 family flavoprotein [Acidimicrobiales bacterium]